MKLAILLWTAALAGQAKDIRFDGNSERNNYLHPEPFARYRVFGHRVELAGGIVTFVVVDSGAPPVEIVTPSVIVQPFLVGACRVEVTRFGETHVTPLGEQVRVVAPQGAEWVAPGQKLIARGAASAPEFRVVGAVSRWRQFFERLGAVMKVGGVTVGGGSDGGATEPARDDDARAKTAEPAKVEPRTQSPGHPNEGPISSAHPSRVGK